MKLRRKLVRTLLEREEIIYQFLGKVREIEVGRIKKKEEEEVIIYHISRERYERNTIIHFPSLFTIPF